MTNREAHEEAAGMGLCNEFFTFNHIDPEGEFDDSIFQATRQNNVDRGQNKEERDDRSKR